MKFRANNFKHKTFRLGFTLIEVIVALSLFTTVMVISVSSLIGLTDAQKRSEVLRQTMDNIDFAMENISRLIRTGNTYHCGSGGVLTEPADCVTGENYIAFEGVSGSTIIFTIQNGQIQKSSNGGASFLGITDPNVNINTMKFYVIGSAPDDNIQPRVLIVVGGSVQVKNETPSSFHLQTTVSERLLDS